MRCPNCNAPEINPFSGLLFIRVNKVHDGIGWCSHCMRCHIWFYEDDPMPAEHCPPHCQCWDIYPEAHPEWSDHRELSDEEVRALIQRQIEPHVH